MSETLDILQENRISYRVFAERLFEKAPRTDDPEIIGRWKQNLVPFLGAGASLGPTENVRGTESASSRRILKSLDSPLTKLGIKSESSRSLVKFAVILARHLDNEPTVKQELAKALEEAQYPPSVNQLVRLFSELLEYKSLRDVAAVLKREWADELMTLDDAALTDILMHFAELTGIRRYTESLANVSSYFETQHGREQLWKYLHQFVGRKTTPTPTHRLVARSAKYYLSQRGRTEGAAYVVVTTNYDCLMERALEEVGERYAVLTVDQEGKVHPRFSKDLEYLREGYVPQYAKDLYVDEWPALVMIYKIHGSLEADDDPRKDNLIISEGDYVRYIAKLGHVPAPVSAVLKDRDILFLAYSLNDWNVRAVFERIREARGRDKSSDPKRDTLDFAVLRDVTTFEQVYCKKKNVTILQTDLDSFVKRIQQHEPAQEENG